MVMLKRARLAKQTEEDQLYPVHCRACGRYLGIKARGNPNKLRMYCADDPWCAVTREWVFPKDRTVDVLKWLVEYEGELVSSLAREFGEERDDLHAWINNRDIRTLRARM
ncbi:hypothetical protein [Microbispora sp. NPDC049633]|uniref:hypothetical protein n=1 Tax=Microbispora sp. NPDC049633 TaxID=3154355 RepID=UPI003429D726